MLHLLKTESILFPWFARFKRQHFARLSAYRRACSVRACSVSCERTRYRLDKSENQPLSEASKRNKNTHTSCFRSNIGSAERRLATGPAEAQATRSVRLSEATTTPNKQAPGTGCTRWWRVGTRVTQNRSQERSGRERRNRKWHRIFFLRICMFFSMAATKASLPFPMSDRQAEESWHCWSMNFTVCIFCKTLSRISPSWLARRACPAFDLPAEQGGFIGESSTIYKSCST